MRVQDFTLNKRNFENIFKIVRKLEQYKWTLIRSELEEENENLKLGMTRMEKTISECDREIDELLDLIQFLTNENRILKVLTLTFSLPKHHGKRWKWDQRFFSLSLVQRRVNEEYLLVNQCIPYYCNTTCHPMTFPLTFEFDNRNKIITDNYQFIQGVLVDFRPNFDCPFFEDRCR